MAEATQATQVDNMEYQDQPSIGVNDLARSNSKANINLITRVKSKEKEIKEEDIPKITAEIAILEGDEDQAPQPTLPINTRINKIAIKIAKIPQWQEYEALSDIDMAQRRAQRLTEYAANLNRYRETISTAAVDIATYDPSISLTGENLQQVLTTVANAQSTINKHPLLKKSKSITKLLLNIVELHKTENTPQQIQVECRDLGNLIIEHPNFTIDEKAQLTSFVLMLRDTIALMSDESIPVIKNYVKGIHRSQEFQNHSLLEQKVINALRPAFRCCSAFTNWIQNLREDIPKSTPFKWTKKLVEWGFNPGTVFSIGSWLNQEAVIHSVVETGKVPEVYPTQYLLFKIAFLTSVAVFGSTVYFYYLDKVRSDTTSRAGPPVASASSPPTLSRSPSVQQSDLLSDDPIRQDEYVFSIYQFLQKFKKDYFPDIEYKEAEAAVRQSLPTLTDEVLGGLTQKEKFNSELLQTMTEQASQAEEEASQAEKNIPQLASSEDKKKAMSRTISSSIIAKQPQTVIRTLRQISSAQYNTSLDLATPTIQGAAAAAEDLDDKSKRPGDELHKESHKKLKGSSAFRRIRKSKRKSVRKSKRTSVRKSPRKQLKKSVRKSLRKSKRKSLRKSLRKSKRKSVGKSKRKSVRKSLRKPVRKSLRKPVKESVRKSLRKSKRKSLCKPVKKSLKKSIRKSTRKNKVMKKSR